jgi:hypothetical protein
MIKKKFFKMMTSKPRQDVEHKPVMGLQLTDYRLQIRERMLYKQDAERALPAEVFCRVFAPGQPRRQEDVPFSLGKPLTLLKKRSAHV